MISIDLQSDANYKTQNQMSKIKSFISKLPKDDTIK